MENPNKNCLEGMRCPSCGSFGPFDIHAQIIVEVSDEGTEDTGSDYEWHDGAACKCNACDHMGTVRTFTEGEDTANDVPLESAKHTPKVQYVLNTLSPFDLGVGFYTRGVDGPIFVRLYARSAIDRDKFDNVLEFDNLDSAVAFAKGVDFVFAHYNLTKKGA